MSEGCRGQSDLQELREGAPPPAGVFPQVSPFPEEGIVGMYPVMSSCKKVVAEHMVRFQRRLEEELLRPRVTAHIVDFKNPAPNPLAQSLDRVTQQLDQMERDIDDIKHKLAVEAIKKKYNHHEHYCPCASPSPHHPPPKSKMDDSFDQ